MGREGRGAMCIIAVGSREIFPRYKYALVSLSLVVSLSDGFPNRKIIRKLHALRLCISAPHACTFYDRI